MTRILDPGRYGANDIQIGDVIECGSCAVSAAQISLFAELTGDRFEIHMSDEAAQKHGFPNRVAHGLLVLSLIDGLKNQAGAQFRARASMGWDWRFRAPVLADDTIFVRITVAEILPAKSADQAILALEFKVTNQDDVIIQSGTNRLLAYR